MAPLRAGAAALLLPLLLAACATQPKKEVPVVYEPDARPLIRSDIRNFEPCFNDAEGVVQALVEVELETSREGFVENARIFRSTDPCLDEPALEAVRRWRYPPRMVDGELARRRGVRVLFAFDFEKDAAP